MAESNEKSTKSQRDSQNSFFINLFIISAIVVGIFSIFFIANKQNNPVECLCNCNVQDHSVKNLSDRNTQNNHNELDKRIKVWAVSEHLQQKNLGLRTSKEVHEDL